DDMQFSLFRSLRLTVRDADRFLERDFNPQRVVVCRDAVVVRSGLPYGERKNGLAHSICSEISGPAPVNRLSWATVAVIGKDRPDTSRLALVVSVSAVTVEDPSVAVHRNPSWL